MFTDTEEKIRRKNQILFTRESLCLQELRHLLCRQSHLTIVLWAFDCLQIPVEILQKKYPEESAAKDAFDVCLAWAHGAVKMPAAKRGILTCHAAAKKITSKEDIALFHAVGQGCSAVHVETHALGLVFYELTAVVIRCGYKNYEEPIREKIGFYTQKLLWWQEHTTEYQKNQTWAAFLTNPAAVNKEFLLLSVSKSPKDRAFRL